MSVLHEVDASLVAAAARESSTASIPPQIVTAVKAEINNLFWSWYNAHTDDVVTTVHFWLFQKTVRVRDLQQVFSLLFGSPGEDMTAERPPATIAPNQLEWQPPEST